MLIEELSSNGLRYAVRDYEAKEPVFFPGDPSDKVCLLLAGQVRLYKEYGTTKEFTAEICVEGDLFGWPEPQGGGAYPRDSAGRQRGAQAITSAEVAFIPAEKLAATLQRSPVTLSPQLVASFMRSVRRSEAAIAVLTNREVLPRVAYVLRSVADSLGREGDGGRVLVEPGFTHEELARMTGCTREAVSKAVGTVRASEAAEISARRIEIKDYLALSQLSSTPGCS